jgi:hypothetical protein
VNADIFRLLVNKVPLNRIVELCGISFPALYDKIRFINRQCALFSAAREARLPEMDLKRLHLGTDRQDYLVNWGSRSNRKTIQLTAVATADRASGYIFAFSPSFDPSLEQAEVEAAWRAADDAAQPPQLRATARVWTEADYAESLARTDAKPLPALKGRSGDEVTVKVEGRDDLDVAEAIVQGQQLPTRGVQVHADYLVHGHFQLLRHLLQGTARLRFALDEDAGLLAACVGAFGARVRDGTAEIVQVRIVKELTIDERRRVMAQAGAAFEAARAEERFRGLDEHQAATAMVAETVRDLREHSPLPERKLQQVWIANPVPDRAEPCKEWRYVSDRDHLGNHDVAFLLRMATLHPVDTVFAVLRRRMAMFERPISSVRRARRAWHIYAAYDPAMIGLLLEIFRTWHNWLWRSPKDGKTAAERLGLTRGEIREDHILGYDMRLAVEHLWGRKG